MKSIWLTCLLMIFAVSCAHKKKEEKPSYSPLITFQEGPSRFESKISLPKDFKDKVPLVIVVHEWWGRTPYILNRAKMLNQAGYAAMAVDLFGDNKTSDNPSDAQNLATPFYQNPEMGISRLKKYIEMASKDPHVNPHLIYVIGYCFGGTQALNLARSGADVKGVVSFHGGLASKFPTMVNLKPKILVMTGTADPMVPAKDVKAFEKEMQSVNADFKIINYEGAKHAFTNPKATEIGKKYNIPIAYDKAADEDSWLELLKFLR
ncbi:MAG TPA: dienelactone hydrolase family protein [Bacteriovoracaceae bacterium]|nr:dienelactone hydrolase family protein [Bacteriovoracaceae bacterium]